MLGTTFVVNLDLCIDLLSLHLLILTILFLLHFFNQSWWFLPRDEGMENTSPSVASQQQPQKIIIML